MRIAAIDIGTNSVHMIVVRVRPDLSFEVIDREKAMVRLGAGGLDGRALTAEAMSAALQALSTFKRLADSHRVDEIRAAATSAVRDTAVRPRVSPAASIASSGRPARFSAWAWSRPLRRGAHRRRSCATFTPRPSRYTRFART